MVFSLYENVSVVFKVTTRRPPKWFIVSSKFKNSTQSSYTSEQGGTDHMNGLQLRQLHTFNALGACSAIFLVVIGLSLKEVPKQNTPSGVLVFKFPGLCAGYSQQLCHNAVGYVIFVWSTKDLNTQKTAEVKLIEFYNKNILMELIETCRESYFYGYKRGDEVQHHMTALSWNGGAGAQMKVVTNEDVLSLEEPSIIQWNKVHASATATQQCADNASVFKDINAEIYKTMTETCGTFGLKWTIVGVLNDQELNNTLVSSYNKKEALIDFNTCYPWIYTKSNLGFIVTGQVDEKTN